MSAKSLAGRKALVTGGARGIGAAIAEALTNAGASVMIGDILADLGNETAGRLAKAGAKTGFVELNVTDDAQWEKAVAATISTLGGYDILINNAGIEITSLVVDLKAEDLAPDVRRQYRRHRSRHEACVSRDATGRRCRRRRRHRQHRIGRGHHRLPGHCRVLRHQIGR
jgi:NAD(P)-dependent dehydrogenase (short-subunit alcohol dehydrogenase family)